MKDKITKDHFVCINLSIEDLHPENLVNLGLISRRLANRIIEDGFSDIREYFVLENYQLARKANFGRRSLKELRQFQNENFKLNLKDLPPSTLASYYYPSIKYSNGSKTTYPNEKVINIAIAVTSI